MTPCMIAAAEAKRRGRVLAETPYVVKVAEPSEEVCHNVMSEHRMVLLMYSTDSLG
jgi:hypothetical protein